MSAFQSYAGAYESALGIFRWRCYATVPIYEARHSEYSPLPKPPRGRKWVRRRGRHDDPKIAWLVDASVKEFSQILLQVETHAAAAPACDVRDENQPDPATATKTRSWCRSPGDD